MKRPNIFDYAKKELSQDAMICWFISCFNSDDKRYQGIGLDFIRFLFDDYSLKREDVDVDSGTPIPQCSHMDVYSVLRVKKEIIPIIFEDKVETCLHSDQMNKYIKKVNGWKKKKYLKELSSKFNDNSLTWGRTWFFYFKTGYIGTYEADNYQIQKNSVLSKNQDVEIKEIFLQNIIDFISTISFKDDLLKDYEVVLQKRRQEQVFGESYCLSDDYLNRQKALEYKSGQIRFMETLFGEKNKISRADHQNWTQKDFYTDLNSVSYFFKLKWQGNQYRLSFRQWDNRRDSKVFSQKVIDYNKAIDICRNISENFPGSINIVFGDFIDSNVNYYNEKNIFEITLKDNPKQSIVNFINYFLEEFEKNNNYVAIKEE